MVHCTKKKSESQPNLTSWAMTLGGSADEYGIEIAASDDGYFYVAGEFYYDMDLNPGDGVDLKETNRPLMTGFLSKYDTDGVYIWSVTWISGEHRVMDMTIDHEGNVFIVSEFSGWMEFYDVDSGSNLIETDDQIILFRVTPDGKTQWFDTWNAPYYDLGFVKHFITTDQSGSVIVGGHGEYLRKYGENGQILINLKLDRDWLGIATDQQDNIYLTAIPLSMEILDSNSESLDYPDMLESTDLVKLDPFGQFLWSKDVSPNLNGSAAIEIVQNRYMYMQIGGNIYKLDLDGEILWNQHCDVKWFPDMAVDNCGNVYIAGYGQGTPRTDPDHRSEGWFVNKFNTDGEFEGILFRDDERFRYPQITISGCDQVFVTGAFKGELGFEGIEVFLGRSRAISDTDDIFILKLDGRILE